MATADAPRRFCRFRTEGEASGLVSPLPAGGFCLSAYVLLRSRPGASDVVAGHIDPTTDWAHRGALGAPRAETASQGWMLPASHLQIFESPDAAATRILEEQLGLRGVPLTGPRVFSERWGGRSPEDPHWDLQFVFEGTWPADRPRAASGWRSLELVDLARTPPDAFVRWHADILALAGTPARGTPETGAGARGRAK